MIQRGMEEFHRRKFLKGLHEYKLDFYRYCVMGKQTRVRFNTAEQKSQCMLDYIHSDMCGPLEVVSLGSFKYFMTLLMIIYIESGFTT